MAIIQPDAALQRIRQQMLSRKGGGNKDPNEYRFPNVKGNDMFAIPMIVLPPTVSMGDLWFYLNGAHFINNKRHECPRIHDNQDCALCQFGFDLMEGVQGKDERSNIARMYLAKARWAINVYFPPVKQVPEELRDKVMWCNLPKALYDKCEACIMRDDTGDESDPQACGIFYDVQNCYVLKVVVEARGDYNDYKSSGFLPTSRRPLAPSAEKIQEILSRRHDLPAKFSARDSEALMEIVRDLTQKGAGAPDGGADSGFNMDVAQSQDEAGRASAPTKQAQGQVKGAATATLKSVLPAKGAPMAKPMQPAKPVAVSKTAQTAVAQTVKSVMTRGGAGGLGAAKAKATPAMDELEDLDATANNVAVPDAAGVGGGDAGEEAQDPADASVPFDQAEVEKLLGEIKGAEG
jgi:hypothetical protein